MNTQFYPKNEEKTLIMFKANFLEHPEFSWTKIFQICFDIGTNRCARTNYVDENSFTELSKIKKKTLVFREIQSFFFFEHLQIYIFFEVGTNRCAKTNYVDENCFQELSKIKKKLCCSEKSKVFFLFFSNKFLTTNCHILLQHATPNSVIKWTA